MFLWNNLSVCRFNECKSSFQGFEVAGVGKTDMLMVYRWRRGSVAVSGWMRHIKEMEMEWRDGVIETYSDALDRSERAEKRSVFVEKDKLSGH